jgi:hypothetical protein
MIDKHTANPGSRIFPQWAMRFFLFFFLCTNGDAEEVKDQLLAPAFLPHKSYTEIYTISALHDDKTFVQVQMTFTNLGVENKNAACRALVLNKMNKPWKVNETFNSKQWKYAEEPVPALSMGVNTLKKFPDKIELSAILGKGTIAISLLGTPSAIKPPNTDYPKNASAKFYDFEIIVPWSKVTTTISLPGTPKKTLQGFGILERSRSIGTSKDVSRGWVTFRGYQNDAFFLANFRFPPQENSLATGWIWKNGQEKPFAMTGLRMVKEKDVHFITALDNSFKIIGHDVLYRYSFVDELGAFTGYLVKMVVGKPITRYYDADVQIFSGKPAMPGVLELMTIE